MEDSRARAAGFTVLDSRGIDEYQAEGVYARHEQTGLEVFHLRNDDRDNLFSFTFKTLPRDSSGVAHILEHSVLCGSRRYPAKDPFVQMLKSSMQTFLNAFTFPDKTSYPASSTVREDFYNLFRVYGDAVFFPLLRPEVFRQEGHRRERLPTGGLQAVGVVYNEMEGAYSTHDSVVGEWAYRSLFPGSPYAFDFGGDPDAILDLSYDDFVAYHRRYYHPGNCRVFLYGNIPTEDHLEFLANEFLGDFTETVAGPPELGPVDRFARPISLEKEFPLASGENPAGKSSVTVNWLLGPVTDPVGALAAEVLAEALLGTAGSPLHKALVESGLGEDLSPATGLESELLELVFSVGLRGTDPEKKAAIEDLILDTLKGMADRGLSKAEVEGALRKVEFRNREIKAGSNFALRLMRRALRGWIHGGGPVLTLYHRPHMEELKRRLAENPRYLEGLLQRLFLENAHRSTLVVRPDPDLAARRRMKLANRLTAEAAAMDEAARQKLDEETAALRSFQEAPESKDSVDAIPVLHRDAVPKSVERIPTAEVTLAGRPAFGHDIYTNGIAYVDLAFDLDGLDSDLYPHLPLYAQALTGSGAGGLSYDRVAIELALKTGGFSTQLEASCMVGSPGALKRFLFVRFKALLELLPDCLALARSILVETDFTDRRRLKDNLVEHRNDLQSSVIPSGHMYVAGRVERAFSAAETVEETWRGIEQLRLAAALKPAKDLPMLASLLERMRAEVITRNRVTLNFTLPEADWGKAADLIGGFVENLPPGADLAPREPSVKASVPKIEGLEIPAAVGYVATALPGTLYGTAGFAAESVLAHLLRTGPLWERIRMKGGAYGAYASTLGLEPVFSFSSYRDPNVVETLAAFKAALEELAGAGPDEATVNGAVIGTAAKETKPLAPSGKSTVGFKRALYGIADDLRDRHHAAVLDVSAAELRGAAERLREGYDQAVSSVMASPAALDAAAARLPGLADNRQALPL